MVGQDAATPAPGRARGDHRRRPGGPAAVQPGRLGRHHPRRPRHPRGRARDRGAGRRPLPHRRRRPRARHGRRRCSTSIGVEVTAGGRRPCTTAPVRAAACSTAGWSTAATPTTSPRLEEAGRPVPGRAADDDRPRRDGRDGRGRGRRWSPVAADGSRSGRPTASPRSAPATTWPGWSWPRSATAPTSPTATSSSVTSKVVSKAEGRVRTRRPRRRDRRGDRTGRRPARRRPASCAHRLGPDHGRGRGRRVQRRRGLRRAAPPRPRRLGPRAARARSHERAGVNVGVRRHRHRRPGLARGPDRHRHRRRRAASSRTTPGAPTRTATRSR